MNTYVTLACLLAVAGLSQGSAIGLGLQSPLLGYGYGHSVVSAPILAPAAISTASMVKAAPIPVIRTVHAPVYTAPIIKTVPIIRTVPVGPIVGPVGLGWDGYGLGGLSGLGGLGLSGLGGKSIVVPNGLGLGGWGKI